MHQKLFLEMTDITIVTQKEYLYPLEITHYIQNILLEYQILKDALENKGLVVERTNWDNPDFDWSKTKAVLIRTTWDYFERIEEFQDWLKVVNEQTILLNPLSLISWNIDKYYLKDLEDNGLNVVPTEFIKVNEEKTLKQICKERLWNDIVIKPAISGGAFHTYKILKSDIENYETLFSNLISERDMLVQEYQDTITTKGEASLMVFNGKYSHAILKKAKQNDFRVQDDFGGTVHHYQPTEVEISFSEKAFTLCDPIPAYGRVDIIWDENNTCYLSELELIEPEIWLRNKPESAHQMVKGILKQL